LLFSLIYLFLGKLSIMALFQKSVLKNHLHLLDNSITFNKAWRNFQAHFHSPEIQENIRNSKEEQYQEGFLDDLFVKVLGYIKNPSPNFNLTTELKNIGNAQKTDGAILKNGEALAVIELKGANTTHLGKIESQAFGYKNHQAKCNYVIISNFEKLRFYIDNATEFEEFNLFELDKEKFKLLYLCLGANNLMKDLAKKIKNESLVQEENITKKLYKDYANFRAELFEDIQKKNPQYDKLTLFNKTQKLLDRFLFIFFAEDKGLLQANMISQIIIEWDKLKKMRRQISLYEHFKEYFAYLNTGFKDEALDIFAYNGGLFLPDKLLDSVQIDDLILRTHTYKLSTYDFESDVSVNILGHIFEHSLSEIEEIQRNLSQDLSAFENLKGLSKRKKDGIFYTPKYITKYIVENTVGKLCQEKKEDLGIMEEEYEKESKGRKKSILKKLQNQLKEYRAWLLEITICDPACGSGAFLNQALEFLISEHQYIDELEAKLLGSALVLTEVENAILEKNLYGVDINEESVEIAKLSLWLRTAKKGRKLITLNKNIKVGNSLIDDKKIAGEKAFKWEKEFPQIFKKGGFDIVIGNPPYVVVKDKNLYANYEWKTDLYLLFIEKSFKDLLKEKALLSFITPRYFMVNKVNQNLRVFMLKEKDLLSLVETSPFEDANTECVISIFKNQKTSSDIIKIYEDKERSIEKINDVKKSFFLRNGHNEILTYLTKEEIAILVKLEKQSVRLNEISQSRRGMEIGKKQLFIKSDIPALIGQDISKYNLNYQNTYIEKSNSQYLRLEKIFENDNIIYLRRVAPELIATITNEKFAFTKNIYGIIPEETCHKKYLLALLNSKLLDFYYKKKFSLKKVDIFPEIQTYLFELLPIKTLAFEEQKPFIEKADKMLQLHQDLQKIANSFLSLLQSSLSLEKINKKMQTWYNLKPIDFLKELKKIAKKNIPLTQQNEWLQFFNQEKVKTQDLVAEINQTDKAIDTMVYKLYNLTEEEIKIVENR